MMSLPDLEFGYGGQGESRMVPDLVKWLRRTRRLRIDSQVVLEFPLHGRRIDMVTATRSGAISAFELKLGNFGRALEQAAYNRFIFDRSWIVVGAEPRGANLEEARKYGIGVIVVSDRVAVRVSPTPQLSSHLARSRVAARLARVGGGDV